MAPKHTKGKATESVSPASQPQSAAPTNSQLVKLRTLHAAVEANWFAQQELERKAEAILTTDNGGITLDNPQREVWETYFVQTRDYRRALKGMLDEIDSAIWLTEKAQAATADTLQDWYANARKTCSCGGHKKGYRNERLAAAWKGELERRGLRPDGREGQFNGDGAS